MSHISRLPSKRKYSVMDILFLPAQRPPVRIILTAAVLAIVGVFGTQSFQILMDTQRIEQQYSVSEKGAKLVQVKYEVDLTRVPMTQEQENTLRRSGLFMGNDSHLIVTARTLEIVWSFIERPIFADPTKGVQRLGLDWNTLSQRFKASFNARLALSPAE